MEKQLRAGAGFSGTPIRLLWRSRRKLERDGGKLKIHLFTYLSILVSVYLSSSTCSCQNNNPSSDDQALFAFSKHIIH